MQITLYKTPTKSFNETVQVLTTFCKKDRLIALRFMGYFTTPEFDEVMLIT